MHVSARSMSEGIVVSITDRGEGLDRTVARRRSTSRSRPASPAQGKGRRRGRTAPRTTARDRARRHALDGPAPGGGTRASFCIPPPASRGHIRSAGAAERRAGSTRRAASRARSFGGAGGERPGRLSSCGGRAKNRRGDDDRPLGHRVSRPRRPMSQRSPTRSRSSPLEPVHAGQGRSRLALVPDGWKPSPVDTGFRGGSASLIPIGGDAWTGGVPGMSATWVDATRVGMPSDFYYLAATGPCWRT